MDTKRDFKSGLKNNNNNNNNNNKNNSNNNINKIDLEKEYNKLPPEQKKQFAQLKNDIGKYQGKDKKDLINDLKSIVSKGKSNGTINDKMIDEFSSKIAPMLDPEQRKNMESIVNMLKGKRG